jgi:transglutaminase-like putative cysteine protease
MRLDIRYVTRFRYSEPIVESQNELRASPANDAHQQVVHYRVTTTPNARVASHVDYWGTRVDTFGVRLPHTQLEVNASATVETHPRSEPQVPVPLDALAEGGWREQHLEFLQPSPHVTWGSEVVAFARDLTAHTSDVVSMVVAVDSAVGAFEYRRGRTAVGIAVDDVLAQGEGVCQDFAHLSIAALRVLGVPARYVSGYFFTSDDATGEDATADEVEVETHAWVEAAIPGHGWWAIDPTNRQVVGERHVAIGRGRDYDDVAPFRGVYIGPVEHVLDVGVTMRRLALQPLGQPGAPGLLLPDEPPGLAARRAAQQ